MSIALYASLIALAVVLLNLFVFWRNEIVNRAVSQQLTLLRMSLLTTSEDAVRERCHLHLQKLCNISYPAMLLDLRKWNRQHFFGDLP